MAKIYDAPPLAGSGLDRAASEEDWTKSGSYEMIYGAPKDENASMAQEASAAAAKAGPDPGSDDGEIMDEEHAAPQLATDPRGIASAAKKAAKGQLAQAPTDAAGWGTGAYDEDLQWEEEDQWDVPEEPKLSEAEVQERLWTLGQGGLPFVVVAAEEMPDGTMRHRPLRVQQNPVINVCSPLRLLHPNMAFVQHAAQCMPTHGLE